MGVIGSTLAKIGTRKIVALVLTSEVIVTVWKEIAGGESETTLLNERATYHEQNIDKICQICTDDHFGQLTEKSLSRCTDITGEKLYFETEVVNQVKDSLMSNWQYYDSNLNGMLDCNELRAPVWDIARKKIFEFQ